MAKQKVVLDSHGNETDLNDPDGAYIVNRSDERLDKFKAALRRGTLNKPSMVGTVDLFAATGTTPAPVDDDSKKPAEDQDAARATAEAKTVKGK